MPSPPRGLREGGGFTSQYLHMIQDGMVPGARPGLHCPVLLSRAGGRRPGAHTHIDILFSAGGGHLALCPLRPGGFTFTNLEIV